MRRQDGYDCSRLSLSSCRDVLSPPLGLEPGTATRTGRDLPISVKTRTSSSSDAMACRQAVGLVKAREKHRVGRAVTEIAQIHESAGGPNGASNVKGGVSHKPGIRV